MEENPRCTVVAEASDGLEAVKRAEELQPDLVLLDIGLPALDGIQVAERIRKLSPSSKILFGSQNDAAELVQEALEQGAFGYLLKLDLAELQSAVDAVVARKRPTL